MALHDFAHEGAIAIEGLNASILCSELKQETTKAANTRELLEETAS